MPAVHGQKAVLPAKVHSDDGADIEVADTSRIIAGGDDVIAVIEALGLGKQVLPRRPTPPPRPAWPRRTSSCSTEPLAWRAC